MFNVTLPDKITDQQLHDFIEQLCLDNPELDRTTLYAEFSARTIVICVNEEEDGG